MKKMKKAFFIIGMMCLSFSGQAQLNFTGPTSTSYCDVANIQFQAHLPGYVDDAFDKIDWRYVFKLWTNGQVVANYTASSVATWNIDYSDHAFDTGPYQVSCDVQYKWGLFWITSESFMSNGINLTVFGTQGEYDANKTSYRMVSGDFDRDGYEDDMAAFYHYGGTTSKLHVWESDGSFFDFQGSNGWWSGTAYDATKTSGRVVSGDFDRDGFKDDIAAIYDYGNNHTRVHIWTSTGSSMTYAGVWWQSGYGANGYNAAKITGRVTVGDFDRDGFEDDICMFYDYGNFTTQAHVLQSNGSSAFSFGSWYNSGAGNFLAGAISYKVVTGDFDRDGYKDDVAAFYAYSGAQTKAFVWRSTGSSFNSPQTWYNSGAGNFDGNKITGRVVSGDFDHDGYEDDITAFYEYSGSMTRAFVWRSTSTSFNSPLTWYNSGSGNFNAQLISGKVTSGDFDRDGYNGDATGLYDYGGLSTRAFTWKSTSTTFLSPATTWEICNPGGRIMNPETTGDIKELQAQDQSIKVYPNPSNGVFTVSNGDSNIEKVEVLSIQGSLIRSVSMTDISEYEINLQNEAKGTYIVKVYANNENYIEKVIVE